MVQKILVGTDFSPAAHRAVERAASLAAATGAELTLLHVMPERGLLDRWFDRNLDAYASLEAGARRALAEELAAAERAGGVKPNSALLNGRAHRAILEAVERFEADLLVLGARGERETAAHASGLGGTAFKVFARVAIPLLLVRKDFHGPYRTALAAVDGSTGSGSVLDWALSLVGDDGTCRLLHAYEAPFVERLRAQNVTEAALDAYTLQQREHWQKELEALAASRQAAGRTRVVVGRGDPAGVILRELLERPADVAVLGRHGGQPRPEGADTYGSVSLRIVFDSPVDTLVVP